MFKLDLVRSMIPVGLILAIIGWGGWIEGQIFPVVKPAVITEAVPGTDWDDEKGVTPFVDLYMAIEKIRDCQYNALSFRTQTGRTIEYLPPPRSGGSRAVGDFVTGPWHLFDVPLAVVNSMRILADHSCPGFPWNTYTDMSPVD